jgi:uncharacterized protein (DUF1330 family)
VSSPAYMIARISVSDIEGYAKYTSQTPAIAAEYGGEFIVRAGRHVYREGSGGERIVVMRFPSIVYRRRTACSCAAQQSACAVGRVDGCRALVGRVAACCSLHLAF